MLYKGDNRRWEIIESMENFFDYDNEDGRLDDILDGYLKENDYPDSKDYESKEAFWNAVCAWYDSFNSVCEDIAKNF